jgi:hypothetical protein
LWPFAAAGLIAVVTVAGLAAVWRSPHRADLEGFAGLAISAAGIAAGWIAWVWRHKSSQGSEVVSGQELGRLTDLLAGAVDEEWTRAAGERGLLEPEPVPVWWQRPVAPFTGPVAARLPPEPVVIQPASVSRARSAHARSLAAFVPMIPGYAGAAERSTSPKWGCRSRNLEQRTLNRGLGVRAGRKGPADPAPSRWSARYWCTCKSRSR